MYAATANGTASDRRREHPQITDRRPNVATNSLTSCAAAPRVQRQHERRSPNIRCAATRRERRQ